MGTGLAQINTALLSIFPENFDNFLQRSIVLALLVSAVIKGSDCIVFQDKTINQIGRTANNCKLFFPVGLGSGFFLACENDKYNAVNKKKFPTIHGSVDISLCLSLV